MDNKFDIKSLELALILDHISEYLFTAGGKNILYNVRPLGSIEDINRSLDFFRQCMSFYNRHSSLLSFDMPDSLDFTGRITYECILEAEDFLGIITVINTSGRLKSALKRASDERQDILEKYCRDLDELTDLKQSICQVFDDEGNIKDNASKLLRSLRREKLSAENNIRDKLRKFINDNANRDIIQDSYITSRNERYVIPVKSSFFKFYKGIVQDKSSSGITSFVEPDFIVSDNNRKKEIEIEERNELLRILKDLSRKVKEASGGILKNIDIIHRLDFGFGISALSFKHYYNIPFVGEDSVIDLKSARHPLLIFIKGYDETIPVDIKIEDEKRIVVITGPNTGGKTVALKTVGLICLMANCGLPVPAEPDSVLPLLDYIMCDIGDEQNINQNLSTFSSHITRISRFLEYANSRSLILIDEIGAGTDPKEGSALGIAILEYLRSKKSIVITSTHYGTIKAFAHFRKGYLTSMVEFNKDTLKPTYRLITGEVGHSNAIYIAGKIGLKKEVIDIAEQHLGEKEKDIERLINSLEEKNKNLSERLSELEHEKSEFRKQQKKQRNILKDRYQVIFEIEKRRLEEIDGLLGRTRAVLNKKKKSRAAGSEQKSPREDIVEIQESAERIREEIVKNSDINLPDNDYESHNCIPEPGSYVKIKNFSGDFQIQNVDRKNNEYEVVLNNVRMKIKEDDIERVVSGGNRINKQSADAFLDHYGSRPVANEINIIGMDAENAIRTVESIIDDAYSAGKPYIRIIHGLGEGILREAVREYLKTRNEIKEIIRGEIVYKNSGITEAVFF